MSAERKKVLELLAEGKISPDEAEKLLDKLASLSGTEREEHNVSSEFVGAGSKALRYLRVQVEKPGGENVNLRIPMSFLRAQSGLHVILPQRILDKLADSGIDVSRFSRLRGQELEDALQQLNIDVDQSNGKKVRIFCE
ncbi:MAG TPA: hypothetical protein VED66_07460 [Candidatus Sulfotelmatobacter sp.]|nr:hypothetical protein [Candidatus Sulfotelmatobacter sp.]